MAGAGETPTDPVLKKFPVWTISAGGSQVDNVGLQFLTIPPDARTLMPDGTKYADFANAHNYFCHPRFARGGGQQDVERGRSDFRV